MFSVLTKMVGDCKGATAIEYCFVASLISISIVVGLNSIGSTLTGIFTSVASSL